MELGSSTVLVTGGASGIGLALAERFLRAGSEVIVCGRREEKLREAKAAHPELQIRVCDLAGEQGRVSLLRWVTAEFPRLNILVNSAGVQLFLPLGQPEQWDRARGEIAINLEAPIHLSMLFIPHLLEQPHPAIVNVTSGLGFVPLARVPVYSATKAALHSFTLSLRAQLSATPIRVVEIIPPAVNTDLGGPGLHTFGVSVDEFADAVFPRIEQGELEVAYGFAEKASQGSRTELEALFNRMNEAPK
ncbi:MAG TPA: SDR family NAD(P)-dependent oxidoreductase [Thermoanaerobaculia bacterium]|nr:SDR family NAD(P)-dependent oxidoreductase [Thermoanaerobaculia bacterium]